jgi:hypothetical protein
VRLELRRQLARSGQRETELERELADSALPLGADLREHREVAAPERWLGAGELQQFARRSAPAPEPAVDPAQQRSELGELGVGRACGNTYLPAIVIIG